MEDTSAEHAILQTSFSRAEDWYFYRKLISMKNVWKYLLILITMNVSAQNLVPNPSFEDTLACPDIVNQVSYAVGWSSYRGSPDYFNSCSNSPLVSVPSNWAGFQYPRTGNAYVGFYSFYLPFQNAREDIGVELTQPLTIGHRYYVSFYTSRGVNIFQYVNVATNKIGAKFSTVEYSFPSPIPLDNQAQVYTDSIIVDTLNWTEIKGFFIADSSYQYLSIGNFFDSSQTSYIQFDSSSAFAYYYIDDVFVADSTPTGVSYLLKDDDNPNIFPNPFQNELIVEGDFIKNISVFDLIGRIWIEHIPYGYLNKINTSNLQKGVYFIKIETSNNSFIQKVIKQ